MKNCRRRAETMKNYNSKRMKMKIRGRWHCRVCVSLCLCVHFSCCCWLVVSFPPHSNRKCITQIVSPPVTQTPKDTIGSPKFLFPNFRFWCPKCLKNLVFRRFRWFEGHPKKAQNPNAIIRSVLQKRFCHRELQNAISQSDDPHAVMLPTFRATTSETLLAFR